MNPATEAGKAIEKLEKLKLARITARADAIARVDARFAEKIKALESGLSETARDIYRKYAEKADV